MVAPVRVDAAVIFTVEVFPALVIVNPVGTALFQVPILKVEEPSVSVLVPAPVTNEPVEVIVWLLVAHVPFFRYKLVLLKLATS